MLKYIVDKEFCTVQPRYVCSVRPEWVLIFFKYIFPLATFRQRSKNNSSSSSIGIIRSSESDNETCGVDNNDGIMFDNNGGSNVSINSIGSARSFSDVQCGEHSSAR